MPGDLVGGKYPLTYTFDKALGLASNGVQSNLSVRSNLEWLGLTNSTDAAASLVSGVLTVVAVPVEIGDVISTVSVVIGATAASTPTHSFAAIYSGVATTAALQGAQSADGTTAVIAASGGYSFTLATPVIVTAQNAPNGYVYAGISETASTVSSLIGGNIATASQTAIAAAYTSAPTKYAGTIGSALAGTAPATVTLASVSGIATAPYVVLS